MSAYSAIIAWQRNEAVFTDNRYSRGHVWRFDGGAEIPASASPSIVPVPCSDTAGIDPEEAFVASLSSCHMLWFLSIAARRGYIVETYLDEASGILEENAEGRLAITRVTLRPNVEFVGSRIPGDDEIQAIHDEAHENCFIANSVKTDVRCEPVR